MEWVFHSFLRVLYLRDRSIAGPNTQLLCESLRNDEIRASKEERSQICKSRCKAYTGTCLNPLNVDAAQARFQSKDSDTVANM